MNTRTTGRRLGVVALSGTLMLGCGVAWASWTHSGTGTANAQATTATALLVSAGSPVGVLYPEPTPGAGYPSTAVGAVYATVTNPNDYPVNIFSVTVGTIGIQPLPGRTCAAGSVVASTPGTMALTTPITLPANSGARPVTIPGAIKMISTAEDGCQAASFTVPVTVTAA